MVQCMDVSDEHRACVQLNTCSQLKLLAVLGVKCSLSDTPTRGDAPWVSVVFRLPVLLS